MFTPFLGEGSNRHRMVFLRDLHPCILYNILFDLSRGVRNKKVKKRS